MAKKKEEYGNDSISSLKGADRVRKRPAVIFGSDGLEGCCHSFFEILSNSIDEAREGYGNVIEVTRFLDGSIEVQDHARGIPLDYNENEQRFNWELVYCELYAGGKYNNNDGGMYEYSLGLNGLGACATQYSSEYMDVTVVRDKTKYTLHFEKGENIGGLHKEPTRSVQTGTTQKWKPDREVFTDINIPLEFYQDTLEKQAMTNAGLKFVLYNETETGMELFEYYYENGIVDYLKEAVGDQGFTAVEVWETERKGRDREDKPMYRMKMQVAFCFSQTVSLLEYYHNSSWLEHGGSPDKAVKNAFVYAIDRYLKSSGKYNKNESKITFNDVADCLALVINSFSTQTSYENQTKKAINNKFIQEAMTEFLRHQLEVYFIENKADAEKISNQVLVNKRSRENAEKIRIDVKKKLTGSMDVTNRVEKFVDCRSKDVSQREIYIVEGDSALGSCKLARDASFQAIMPIRGKILNCLKADYAKIFKSDIILDLVRVLGCGIEIKSKHNKGFDTFDLDNLRWSKVIICTDADVDGFQIRTLVLTMIYRLMPTLIEAGKVYIAESPLYEISIIKTKRKGEKFFAYTDREKEEILQRLIAEGLSKEKDEYEIKRSKGLGENQPDMMSLTTMHPATRRLIRVTPENVERTAAMFDILLGDNIQSRKDYIAQYGNLYMELLDLS
ncbi:MAG TPA: DNA topoisomerase [Candidatus Avimonoglobus intestinipullorum]|uniref:DNA topoisomerase (ATP-hydrolyzing) n=1 Tax=Candidatus Avimonoglobus intestinipullorum TaxID=2840699 RepID=A0A9D1S6B5_9FIRM|nr:DNA topoisomerase [Candidatus Avimonoglobus intestinipullorum]